MRFARSHRHRGCWREAKSAFRNNARCGDSKSFEDSVAESPTPRLIAFRKQTALNPSDSDSEKGDFKTRLTSFQEVGLGYRRF